MCVPDAFARAVSPDLTTIPASRAVLDSTPLRRPCSGRCEPYGADHCRVSAAKVGREVCIAGYRNCLFFCADTRNTCSHRAAKAGKTSGVAADAEYRAVLDHLVADLLATLHLPEWPGSDILLTTLCRSMVKFIGSGLALARPGSLT